MGCRVATSSLLLDSFKKRKERERSSEAASSLQLNLLKDRDGVRSRKATSSLLLDLLREKRKNAPENAKPH